VSERDKHLRQAVSLGSNSPKGDGTTAGSRPQRDEITFRSHLHTPILDLVIVAGMQRIEHYEIAAYGTDLALAKALGEKEVSRKRSRPTSS